MKEFDFYGEHIVVSDGRENYVRLRQEMEKIAGQLKADFIERYKASYTNIDQVVANVFNLGEELILGAASWCIELMGKNHIYNYNTERFIKSYGLTSMEVWINGCDKIANSYTSIIVNAQVSMSVKQWQQNYRGKWLGNAFSSMPAMGKPPLDWSTGLEYPPVGDSIAPDVYPNLVALFNSPKTLDTLAEALYRCVLGLHQGLVRVLMEQSDHLIEGLDDERLRDFPVIFSNITQGLVAKEDVIAQAAELIRIYPFRKELYMYMFDHYGDPDGVLSEMTGYFGLGDFMQSYKIQAVETKLADVDFSGKQPIAEGMEMIRELCRRSSVDDGAYMAAFEELLELEGTYARSVDGIVYDDEASAGKAREELKALFDAARDMSGNDEEKLEQLIGEAKAYTCQSRQKYISWLEQAEERAKLRHKTVKNIMFDTEEEADQARRECKAFEDCLKEPCGSQDALKALKEQAEAMKTKIRELYIQLVGMMGDVWSHQDILYSTRALYRPEKRTDYTAMWFEALELYTAGELLGLKNEAYLKWFEMMRQDFLTVKGVLYDNAPEANRSYYRVLSHAIAYKRYIDEKNNTSKGFFSSIKNSVSGLWAENYQDDFGWLTQGGTRFIPPDTEEEGRAMEGQYGAMMQAMENNLATIRTLMDRIHVPYEQQDEPVSLENMKISDRHVSAAEILSVMNKACQCHPLELGNIRAAYRDSSDNVCQKCGAPLPDEAVFCPRCGTRRS